MQVQLCLIALIGAIAAGCCAVIKPSEVPDAQPLSCLLTEACNWQVSPQCALLTEKIVSKYLDPDCYRVVQVYWA